MGQKKLQNTNLKEKLQDDFKRWDTLLNQGGNDPFWNDGYNMNQKRRHIINDKMQLKEHFPETEFPEEYYRPLPPIMPDSYIARAGEIWYNALKTHQIYQQNEDYKYLCSIKECISEEIKKKSCIDAVIGYVEGLKRALTEKDFLSIRRHETAASYLESFHKCREDVGELLLGNQELSVGEIGEKSHVETEEQLDLFHMGLNLENKSR